MKTVKRKNAARTAAFVSALVLVLSGSGMAGTAFSVSNTITASAAAEFAKTYTFTVTANDTVEIAGSLFELNSGDTVQITDIQNAPDVQTIGIATTSNTVNIDKVSERTLWAICTKRSGSASGVVSETAYYYAKQVSDIGGLPIYLFVKATKEEYEEEIASLSASETETQEDGISVSGAMFGLKAGDNATLYLTHNNGDGNAATTALTQINADTNEVINPSYDFAVNRLFVKRFVRTGSADGVKTTIDYFYYNDTASAWVYAGANDWQQLINDFVSNQYDTENGWQTSANTAVISASKEDFGLKKYAAADAKQDTVCFYSTALSADGEKTYIGTLTGADVSDMAFHADISKNTGYIAVKTVGGTVASTSKQLETDKMYRYDMESGQWVLFYDSYADKGESKSFNTLTLFPKAKTFPMLADKDVQELRIYRIVDGVKTLIQTFDKKTFDGGWGAVTQKFENDTVGFCYAPNYEQYTWEADVQESFTSAYVDVHSTKCISGKFLANIPYATSVAEGSSEETMRSDFINDLAPTTKANGAKALPVLSDESAEASGQTRPVYLNDMFSELERGNHGTVCLYQGITPIVYYTAEEFDSGCFSIPDFSKDYDYFLKVYHTEDETGAGENYYTMYKWDENTGKWKFRVNTEETPVVNVPITHAEFAAFLPDYTVNLNLVTGSGDNRKSTTISSWTKEEFDKGSIQPALTLQTAGDYEVEFICEKDEGKEIYGTVTYQYVGIDPVYVDGTVTCSIPEIKGDKYRPVPEELVVLENTANIAPITNAKANDAIVVNGTAADGNAVHYETTAEVDNASVRFPEGSFTVTDETAGYKADVEVSKDENGDLYATITDKSSVDDRYVNVRTPVEINSYVLMKPNGTVIETGTMKGASLKASDLSLSANQLKAVSSYTAFTAESGIINSTDGTVKTEESGYMAVVNSKVTKISGETMKGDLNADNKLTVADVIALQKYLHGKNPYTAEKFISADMNNDGNVNIFDLSLMKKTLLKK